MHGWGKRLKGASWTVASFLLVFVIWDVSVRLFAIPQYLVPAPAQVLVAGVVHGPQLLREGLWTMIEVLLGFGLSAAVAVPLAMLIVLSPTFDRLLSPLLVATQSIPKVAIAPLFIVWFGFGTAPKVAVAFLIAFFPIVVDTVVGLKGVEPAMVQMAKSMDATPMRIFLKLRLPHALPNVFAGLKVASTLAVVGAITGEFIGSDRGLGYLLVQAGGIMDTPLLFAALAVLSILAMIFFYVVEGVEKALIPWHVSQRDH